MRLKSKTPLGQLLVDKKLITPEQLAAALTQQKETNQLLGHTLVRMGFLDEEHVMLPVLAEQLGVDFITLKNMAVVPEALSRLPAKAANHYKVFPVKLAGDVLTIATHHPLDVSALDDLALISKSKILPVLAAEKEILESIRDHYGVGTETIEKMMGDVDTAQSQTEIQSIDASGDDASISQFLNQILYQAFKDKASDIHIEPFEDQLRIRYRIDGVLYDANAPDNIRFFQDAIMSRIKIMANLNIAEKRMPQDGRFKVRVNDQDLDLRVSFVPTPFGESVVLRLLNSLRLYSFEELGLIGQEKIYLDEMLNKPHGIIFMTGPTGSGKTTTLYTCLASVNKEDTKIITIEDPVEYQMRGITQIQTHAMIGLTFANALRSVLRQDPDIIMVGEVRDVETAQITIQTALTGHLVFSTLHTNDAATGVSRLIDMGVEAYLISSSVVCFIAQRLVRLLCPECKQEQKVDDAMIKEFGVEASFKGQTVYESKGCKHCRQTGFVGRQAICEFLILNDELRAMIVKRATAVEIKNKAIALGMKTLRRQGWEKVIKGITAPSEVLRATHED